MSGESVKPTASDAVTANTIRQWKINNDKAKSDIIFSINPSELKQIKRCETSKDVLLKLESNQSKKISPKKADALLKQLILQRIENGADVREHICKFFDAVDKLGKMEVDIDSDLLSIILLYSLLSSFENFRCAIESRNKLSTPEMLRIKIVKENDPRLNAAARAPIQNTLYTNKNRRKTRKPKRPIAKKNDANTAEFKYRCYRCGTIGHKTANCTRKQNGSNEKQRREKKPVFVHRSIYARDYAFRATSMNRCGRWCFDSGLVLKQLDSRIHHNRRHQQNRTELSKQQLDQHIRER